MGQHLTWASPAPPLSYLASLSPGQSVYQLQVWRHHLSKLPPEVPEPEVMRGRLVQFTQLVSAFSSQVEVPVFLSNHQSGQPQWIQAEHQTQTQQTTGPYCPAIPYVGISLSIINPSVLLTDLLWVKALAELCIHCDGPTSLCPGWHRCRSWVHLPDMRQGKCWHARLTASVYSQGSQMRRPKNTSHVPLRRWRVQNCQGIKLRCGEEREERGWKWKREGIIILPRPWARCLHETCV